ncbi:MAG: type II secretion system minor pseudopilin GspI [Gammaproteobacteria bacterium]
MQPQRTRSTQRRNSDLYRLVRVFRRSGAPASLLRHSGAPGRENPESCHGSARRPVKQDSGSPLCGARNDGGRIALTRVRNDGAGTKRPGVSRGFTLIEVLVALAVIAIGLLAVLAVASQGTRISSELQQRNFANWVAQNEIARLHLDPKWPKLGDSNDDVEMASQKWHWEATVEKTQDPDLRRVTITVSLASQPDQSVTKMIAFIGRPPPEPVALPTPSPAGASGAAAHGTSP